MPQTYGVPQSYAPTQASHCTVYVRPYMYLPEYRLKLVNSDDILRFFESVGMFTNM